MSKPVLGYWNYRAFGNPPRFLLAHAEVDYEERRYSIGPPPEYSWGEWMADKYNLGLDFPNVPYWIEPSSGLKLTQLLAIMKHLAQTYAPELMPDTNVAVAQADMLDSIVVGDLFNELGKLCYNFSEDILKDFNAQQPRRLAEVSKFLGSKAWLLGPKISYVDFILYEALHCHRVYDAKLLEPFENFTGFMKQFEALPSIKKYMASPRYISSPCFSPKAKIKI